VMSTVKSVSDVEAIFNEPDAPANTDAVAIGVPRLEKEMVCAVGVKDVTNDTDRTVVLAGITVNTSA